MAISRFHNEYRFLSNFYPHPIQLGGIRYPTVEHAYQALKSRSHATRKHVASLATPGQAKRFGRTIAIRPDWDEVKISIMSMLLEKKFSDPRLRTMLLNTGKEQLVEGNTWGDTFWGVCYGKGENNLGKLLMVLRERLRRDGSRAIPTR